MVAWQLDEGIGCARHRQRCPVPFRCHRISTILQYTAVGSLLQEPSPPSVYACFGVPSLLCDVVRVQMFLLTLVDLFVLCGLRLIVNRPPPTWYLLSVFVMHGLDR